MSKLSFLKSAMFAAGLLFGAAYADNTGKQEKEKEKTTIVKTEEQKPTLESKYFIFDKRWLDFIGTEEEVNETIERVKAKRGSTFGVQEQAIAGGKVITKEGWEKLVERNDEKFEILARDLWHKNGSRNEKIPVVISSGSGATAMADGVRTKYPKRRAEDILFNWEAYGNYDSVFLHEPDHIMARRADRYNASANGIIRGSQDIHLFTELNMAYVLENDSEFTFREGYDGKSFRGEEYRARRSVSGKQLRSGVSKEEAFKQVLKNLIEEFGWDPYIIARGKALNGNRMSSCEEFLDDFITAVSQEKQARGREMIEQVYANRIKEYNGVTQIVYADEK